MVTLMGTRAPQSPVWFWLRNTVFRILQDHEMHKQEHAANA